MFSAIKRSLSMWQFYLKFKLPNVISRAVLHEKSVMNVALVRVFGVEKDIAL